MSAIDAFDCLAPEYDAWYETPLGAFVDAREKEAVLAMASVRTGEKALDVGCGTGVYTLELVRRGARAIGVDPAARMLERAATKAEEAGLAVGFVRAIAEDLPFVAQSFDLVMSVTTLEFVGSPQKAVTEMARVLRPGGRLVVGVLNAWSLWALYYRRQKGTVFEHARFFSALELLRLLRSHGAVVWRSCVFVLPWYPGRPGAFARTLERSGSRALKPFGAFLAARLEKHG